MNRTAGKTTPMLVAVTGGIASGKSTVSRMLEELGAPLIDLDVLARQVVEPGKPAWREIVDYFGREILLPDGRIDRKKLSAVVFRDSENRRRVENLTHPPIFEEMCRQVVEIAAATPNAIIQIGIPLLFELNLQHRFHKVLLAYAPREVQLRRLMKRDGIDERTAESILNAQLPIEEKTGYADFVIHNDGPIEETRRQVEEVWRRLEEEQRKMKEEAHLRVRHNDER